VHEDGGEDGRVGEKGEDLHGAATGRTEERQDLIDPGEEHGPADPRRAGGARKLVQVTGDGAECLSIDKAGRLGRSSTEGDDGGTQTGMRREDAVIAVAVHARRWREGDEALEELQRREDNLGAPTGVGLGNRYRRRASGEAREATPARA